MDRETATLFLGALEFEVQHVDGANYRRVILPGTPDTIQQCFNTSLWVTPAEWKNLAKKQDHEYWDSIEQESVEDEDGSFVKWLEIPSPCIGHIVGKGGANIRQLQKQTSTRIFIDNPADGDTSAEGIMVHVRISGKVKSGVQQCFAQLHEILSSVASHESLATADFTPKWTHFVCIPLDTGDFPDHVAAWHSSVQSAVEGRVLIPVKRLHLTLCMLQLDSDAKLQHAIRTFQSLQSASYDALDTRTVQCQFNGLDVLTELTEDSSVVITRPELSTDGEKRLNAVTALIIGAFMEAGLLSRAEGIKQRVLRSDPKLPAQVQFHATLINGKFGTAPTDFTSIAKAHRLLPLGKAIIRRIVLCARVNYEVVAQLNL